MSSYWIDTDCLIWAKRNSYPLDSKVGAAFWSMINDGFERGVIKMCRQVFQEINAGRDPKDALRKWLAVRKHLCIPTSQEAQKFASKIGDYLFSQGSRYEPRHLQKFCSGADPWVVACAAVDGGAVVSNEKPEPLTKKPKVADVCKVFNVRCIHLHKLVFCLEGNVAPEHCTDDFRD